MDIELTIHKILSSGDGMGVLEDGRKVFVPFTAPGERVRVRLGEGGRDFVKAGLIEVLEESPDRVEPACPLYGECGGCNLQHLSYDRQLEVKKAVIVDACARAGGFTPPEFDIVGSPPFGARNRIQPRIARDGSKGFMRSGSDEFLRAASCPACHPLVSDWLSTPAEPETAPNDAVLDAIKDAGKDAIRPTGRAASAKADARGAGSRDPACERRVVVFGSETGLYVEGIDAEASATLCGREFLFPVTGFFQNNLAVFETMLDACVRTQTGTNAVDLYSGCGVMASFLCERFGKVYSVERDPLVSSYTSRNAPKAASRPMDSETWTDLPEARGHFDLIAVDPPRTGLSGKVRTYLRKASFERLMYLSCDPATFARDSGELLGHGFEIESMSAWDFYPQTAHVETLATFTRRRR